MRIKWKLQRRAFPNPEERKNICLPLQLRVQQKMSRRVSLAPPKTLTSTLDTLKNLAEFWAVDKPTLTAFSLYLLPLWPFPVCVGTRGCSEGSRAEPSRAGDLDPKTPSTIRSIASRQLFSLAIDPETPRPRRRDATGRDAAAATPPAPRPRSHRKCHTRCSCSQVNGRKRRCCTFLTCTWT